MSAMTEFESALSRFVEGAHSPDDESLLLRSVETDAGARAAIRQHLALEDLLRQHGQRDPEAFVDALRMRLSCADDEPFVERVRVAMVQHELRAMMMRQRAWKRFALAAAALLAISVVGWVTWSRGLWGPGAEVTVIAATDAAAWPVGARRELRRFTVSAGHSLSLRLDSGVRLDVGGQAEMRLTGPSSVHLDLGRLWIDTGSHEEGFVVTTAAGVVTDLGTEFYVEAAVDAVTQVAVFSGEVKVEPARGSGLNLNQGEGVRFTARGATQRIAALTVANVPGAQKPSTLVREVRVRWDGPAMNRLVIASGMKPGALAFPDRATPAWQAVEGQSFPAELRGADLVQTMLEERWNAQFQMQMDVAQPCDVFVLHDARSPAPAWLRAEFRKTALRVRSGPWAAGQRVVEGLEPDARGELWIACEVWKRRVPAAGVVELGPPHPEGTGGSSSMYGVAVKQLPGASPPRKTPEKRP
jgi:hypothetical protein